MSNSTIMSPRLLGSFEYGRPSPAMRRTVVGFIMSGILSVAARLLSVGTSTVAPPSIAYHSYTAQLSAMCRIYTILHSMIINKIQVTVTVITIIVQPTIHSHSFYVRLNFLRASQDLQNLRIRATALNFSFSHDSVNLTISS